MKILLVMIYVVFTTLGLILMKLGGNTGQISFQGGNLGFNINYISAIGFICYLISFLLYTRIITMFNLSYIVPLLTGVVQVIILIASVSIFKEDISIYGIIGVISIICGMILLNIKR